MSAVLGQVHGTGVSAPDPLLDALRSILQWHGIRRSRDSLRAGLPPAARMDAAGFVRAARAVGCHAELSQRSLADIPDLVMPVVVEMHDGSAAVLLALLLAGGVWLAALYTRFFAS